jgi:hypothetical protein
MMFTAAIWLRLVSSITWAQRFKLQSTGPAKAESVSFMFSFLTPVRKPLILCGNA